MKNSAELTNMLTVCGVAWKRLDAWCVYFPRINFTMYHQRENIVNLYPKNGRMIACNYSQAFDLVLTEEIEHAKRV